MANKKHLKIIKKRAQSWNAYREENRGIAPDLRGADLRSAIINDANLGDGDLSGAKFSSARPTEVEPVSPPEDAR